VPPLCGIITKHDAPQLTPLGRSEHLDRTRRNPKNSDPKGKR